MTDRERMLFNFWLILLLSMVALLLAREYLAF